MPRQFNIVFASCFKAENPYLREWLEYHHLVGVSHFYLYDNDDTVAAKELLAPYVEAGIATVHPWMDYEKETFLGKRKQHRAFAHCVQTYRDRFDWILKIDIDEFLVPTDDYQNIPQALALYDSSKVRGIRVPRYNFGNNGYLEPSPGLLLEAYTRREASFSNHKDIANSNFLSSNAHCNSSHWWHYRLRYYSKAYIREAQVRGLRIHHYYTKSYEEYMKRQNPSGGRILTDTRFLECVKTQNQVEDTSMLRFVSEIKKRLNGFRPRSSEYGPTTQIRGNPSERQYYPDC